MQVQEIKVRILPDQDGDPSYLEQEVFADRRAEYERGAFEFIGIDAVATVEVAGILQEITSGGLWSIESDSDADYLRETGREQLVELASVLDDLGATYDFTSVDPTPTETR